LDAELVAKIIEMAYLSFVGFQGLWDRLLSFSAFEGFEVEGSGKLVSTSSIIGGIPNVVAYSL